MNKEFNHYYKKNTAILKKNYPKIWKLIEDEFIEPMGTISFSSSGHPNLLVKNNQGKEIVFHNGVNPEKESNDFVNRIPSGHKGFVAVLGIGLGQHILTILNQRPEIQSLAVFEIEPGIFLQALKFNDLSALLKDPRLILCVGPEPAIEESLAPASKTLQLENATILNHYPSLNYNQPDYIKLQENLFNYLNTLNVDGATTRLLGQDFLNNRFKHISTIHHHYLFEQLKNKFSNIPAILVAGGPSLNKNVHLLQEAQDKAVILAVDTVLPTLIKHGVHPHFMTCIDPNNLTFEKFSDVIPTVKNVSLICSSWVNPKTPKIFPAAQTFWTFTAKPMEAWLNSLLGGNLFTGGASTVAHMNLIAANILGCDPIIFIGQDLAYPESDTHAKGTVLQGSAPTKASAAGTQGETVKGIDGSILRTNRSFLSMKSHFETFIASSDKTYINSTEGGAHIEGTVVNSLSDSINNYCRSEISIQESLRRHYDSLQKTEPENMLKTFKEYLDKINQLQRDIKNSDELVSQTQKKTNSLIKKNINIASFQMLPQKMKNQITKIDNFHKKLDSALEIWKILEEITMEGLKQSERNRHEINALKTDPSKYAQWLNKNFDRLLQINIIRKQTLDNLKKNFKYVIEFHRKEKQLLAASKSNDAKNSSLLELAKLYLDTGNYSLARPIVEDLFKEIPESSELNFFQGCLSRYYSIMGTAERFFNTAVELRPELSKSIAEFHQALGDEFLDFVRYFKTQTGREASVKHMIFKGLEHCPDHVGLNSELRALFRTDMESISKEINEKRTDNAMNKIQTWLNIFNEKEHLQKKMPSDLVSHLYLHKAKVSLAGKKYSTAADDLKIALDNSPADHDLHFLLIDTYFMAENYSDAINAINQAIKIDREFAAYWETIGDSLKSGEQYEDAIIAYEKCYTNLPEKINLIYKIGECYLAMNRLEAAKAAFEQFKLKVANIGSNNLPE